MSLARLADTQTRSRDVRVQSASEAHSDDRFDLLTKYIPAETVTLYVGAVAANVSRGANQEPLIDPWFLYGAGAVLTPLILCAIGYIRQSEADPTQPFKLQLWPAVAAVIAYLVWALSVPGGVNIDDTIRPFAAFGALLTSTLLGLADPIFRPRAQAPAPTPAPSPSPGPGASSGFQSK